MGCRSVMFGAAVSLITFILLCNLPKEHVTGMNISLMFITSTIAGLIAEIIKIKLYK